jgi:TonB family protein
MSLKTFYFSLIYLSSICIATAQKDTIYLDVNGAKVAPPLAAIYQIHTQVKKSQVEIVEEYDAILGYRKRYYMLKKMPQWMMEEVCITGYSSVNGQRSEPIKYEPRVIIHTDSVMIKHGSLMEWYPSGALKARGTYLAGRLNGTLETFHSNDKPMQIEEYHLDTLIKATCFDSLGTEITHIPFFELPKYPQGASALFKFLSQTVRYPREAREIGAQETIFVQFTISKIGKVIGVKTLKSKSKFLATESIKTIESLPNWIPAKTNGKPIEMTFLMPFTYRLE